MLRRCGEVVFTRTDRDVGHAPLEYPDISLPLIDAALERTTAEWGAQINPPGPAEVNPPTRAYARRSAQDGAAEGVVKRQAVAQAVRHGEHPLAHRDGGQHGVDEVRRLLGHATAAAARADGPRFTGERHEALEPARVAPDAGEAPVERATAEEVPELALDKARHPDAVGGGGRLREEALEVRAHDLVEHGPGRRPWRVDPRQHAAAQPMPCRPSQGEGASASRAGLAVRAGHACNRPGSRSLQLRQVLDPRG